MPRNIDEVIERLPRQRRDRIEQESRRLALEMIRQAASLDVLRKAVGQTQAELAVALGIGQNAISQLESRTDLYLSTLNKYVEALGLRLEIALLTPEGERIELPNFRPWDEDAVSAPVARKRRTAAPPAQRAETAKRARVRGSSR